MLPSAACFQMQIEMPPVSQLPPNRETGPTCEDFPSCLSGFLPCKGCGFWLCDSFFKPPHLVLDGLIA